MKKNVLSFIIISFALVANAKQINATSQSTDYDYSRASLSACNQAENQARTNANSSCVQLDGTSFLSTFRVMNKNTNAKTEHGFTTATCTVTADYSCY